MIPALIFALPEWKGEELEEKVMAGGFCGTKVYLQYAPSYIPVKNWGKAIIAAGLLYQRIRKRRVGCFAKRKYLTDLDGVIEYRLGKLLKKEKGEKWLRRC
ncbi:MAG: hypothetical protein V2A65_09055 [Candidatus Omnitrophota bacterium]